MTREGEPNVFGRFTFTAEQARRVKAGDMTAAWEFIEDNRKFLTNWARRFIRINLAFMPDGYYEADELLNQIFVDFPLYRLESEKGLISGIYRSFRGISCGGYARSRYRMGYEKSIDAPLAVSERSGDIENGDTMKDLLPSREPTPSAALEAKEHVKEIAPRYFRELGRIFKKKKSAGGATVGEMLAAKNGERAIACSAFETVIEQIFFGYSFEEIRRYAEGAA